MRPEAEVIENATPVAAQHAHAMGIVQMENGGAVFREHTDVVHHGSHAPVRGDHAIREHPEGACPG